MKRLFTALSLCSIMFFMSCGDKKTDQAATDQAIPGKTTIEFMMWGTPDELETVKGYLRKFQDENQDIFVKIIHKNDFDGALQTYFAGGTPPDVFYMGSEPFPNYASRDQLLDLTPLIKRDAFSMEDFYSQLEPNFTWDGKIFGIPKDFTTLVLYYNKDLFTRAGVEFPKATWTWDDFLKACQTLTKDFESDGTIDQYGFAVETWIGEWFPWVMQNGGKIISPDNKKWLMGDSQYLEKNAAALQFLADLIYKHKVAPTVTATRDKDQTEQFKSGQIAMCTYGRWKCMQFKDIKNFEWDVQVLPMKEKRASTLFTVAYSIAKDSKHPEEAWKLVKFLTGSVGQKATAMSGQAIPSMKSIAASDDFLAAPAVPQKINATVFLDSIEYAVAPPTNTKWSRINEILGRELQKVWENTATAKEILTATQKELQAILDEKD